MHDCATRNCGVCSRDSLASGWQRQKDIRLIRRRLLRQCLVLALIIMEERPLRATVLAVPATRETPPRTAAE